MRLSERALRRGLAPTAASDWRAADLPAALQGGARQAIFRGLYKGAEAAGELDRAGEGRCDTSACSREPGRPGLGCALASDPRCGTLPGRWCPDPVRIRGNGSPPRWPIGKCDPWCWVGMPPAVQPVEWRRSRRGVGGKRLGLPNKHGKEGSEGEAKHRTASHTQK